MMEFKKIVAKLGRVIRKGMYNPAQQEIGLAWLEALEQANEGQTAFFKGVVEAKAEEMTALRDELRDRESSVQSLRDDLRILGKDLDAARDEVWAARRETQALRDRQGTTSIPVATYGSGTLFTDRENLKRAVGGGLTTEELLEMLVHGRIRAIKMVRDRTALGLAEAKDMVCAAAAELDALAGKLPGSMSKEPVAPEQNTSAKLMAEGLLGGGPK